ncbi:MAG TPA: TFIIB-type zinc ribbon-containing protein, partial [archaeon]|nr:TFIIB-type zinc ribbon-containing protein [archaeon]
MKCPSCKGNRLVHDYEQGEIICSSCGVVIDEKMMDSRPEWRSFNDSSGNRSRGEAALKYSVANRGFTTSIRRTSIDAKGNPLGTQAKAEMYSLM